LLQFKRGDLDEDGLMTLEEYEGIIQWDYEDQISWEQLGAKFVAYGVENTDGLVDANTFT
jgi:hypothetical protein